MIRRSVLLLVALCAAACGDLSPAKPTTIEQEPLLTLAPVQPLRLSNGSVQYLLGYSFINPKVATGPVVVTRAEFTITGGDGSVYATGEDALLTFGRTSTIAPGTRLGGFGFVFTDANTTHPTATTYTVRVFYARSDGSNWKLEQQSAVLPAR